MGSNFNLGGLAGFPFAGNMGFQTMSSNSKKKVTIDWNTFIELNDDDNNHQPQIPEKVGHGILFITNEEGIFSPDWSVGRFCPSDKRVFAINLTKWVCENLHGTSQLKVLAAACQQNRAKSTKVENNTTVISSFRTQHFVQDLLLALCSGSTVTLPSRILCLQQMGDKKIQSSPRTSVACSYFCYSKKKNVGIEKDFIVPPRSAGGNVTEDEKLKHFCSVCESSKTIQQETREREA
eukprot:scaffold4663_cov109-Cylindrotheca_fusiformis.AAC.11